MALTLASAARALAGQGLLREIIAGDQWTMDPDDLADAEKPFADLTYDTRRVGQGTLLFCKGNFKAEYLDGCDGRGLAAWVAQSDLSTKSHAPGLVVTDVKAAMALLAMEYYGHPERELTLVGITGTKGKTTTAYLTQAMLAAESGGRCALFSSVDNCLNGRDWVESDLTTPESLDAIRMMRQARDAGMEYLVMEVSSQAYKVGRVDGLTFDVGAFLNISPDHISAIEHPTFEDYLWCKRQITAHARALVLGADCAHRTLIEQDAKAAGTPVTYFAARTTGQTLPDLAPMVAAVAADETGGQYRYMVDSETLADLTLGLDGVFNAANAAAAIAIARLAVASRRGESATLPTKVFTAMEHVHIPGRMERYEADGIVAYVDYAHNYASTRTLVDFVHRRYAGCNPRITLVTGSVGDKAVDRREGIMRGAQEGGVDHVILTSEDTVRERMIDICHEMRGYLTDPHVTCREEDIILDRAQAIEAAIDDARAHADRLNIVLVIGKGDERWIKVEGKHAPYEGDDRVVRRLLGLSSPVDQANQASHANQAN